MLRALEDEVARVADIHRDQWDAGMESVQVEPRNSDARSISWTYLGSEEIVLEVGRYGGRWELTRSREDIAFLTDIVRSVIAGRVRETFGWRRSRVEVTFPDGTTAVETGYVSFIPTPGWRRRGKTIQYAPYAAD